MPRSPISPSLAPGVAARASDEPVLAADERERLICAASAASAHAHAPYSRFQVGAALLAADGQTFVGCNVENASYSLTLCAERVAAVAAIASPAVLIVGDVLRGARAISTPYAPPTVKAWTA